MPADVPLSKSIPQNDTTASSAIEPSIKEKDSPRLADNRKSSDLGQYKEETVPVHQEPSVRIAPVEKMNSGIHRDRAIAD